MLRWIQGEIFSGYVGIQAEGSEVVRRSENMSESSDRVSIHEKGTNYEMAQRESTWELEMA